MTYAKKLYLILLFLIAVAALLLFREVRLALGIHTKQASKHIIEFGATALPIDATDPIYGNPGAAITIVEFANLGCSECQKDHYILTKVVDNNPKAIRLVWKDAPSYGGIFSQGTLEAHLAARCAFKIGGEKRFWDFVKIAMQDKTNLRETGLQKIASGLKLDLNQWTSCRNSAEVRQEVEQTTNLGAQIGLSEIPALFVDNQKINLDNNIDLEELLTKIIQK